MPRLTLVRHGHPSAGFGHDPDPGLDERGLAQAAAMAAVLKGQGPLPIVVSPMRRARDTAAPLEAAWASAAIVEPSVGEVRAPAGAAADRQAWLDAALAGTWDDLEGSVRAWHGRVIAALLALSADTVVVTHFMAINAAVGAAAGDRSVRVFRPDHCSCTVLDHDGGTLRVVELGRSAPTEVG